VRQSAGDAISARSLLDQGARMITPATRVGPYEILSRIGAGGMGEVWRARDTRIGRDVAIKIPPPEFASSVVSNQTTATSGWRR
jgi:serine/threonine protein kinase